MVAMLATLITGPVHVLAVLLAVLALLFVASRTRLGKRVFGVVPLLLFCYFVPTTLSNTGVIPSESGFPLYGFVMQWLLPSSLLLLVMAVDIPAILRLGRSVLILFATAIVSIVLAGPLALLLLGWLFEPESLEQAWRGLAALSGSWIGGGANMLSIKESVQAGDDVFAAIVVVDVAVAEAWTAVLFVFAAREQRMDAAIGADRRSLDHLVERAQTYQKKVNRPTDLASLLAIFALAFGATVLAHEASLWLEANVAKNDVLRAFTWKVLLITAAGIALSFTPIRRLEGAGSSHVGAAMLYLLVATIGAKAHFTEIAKAENLPLVAVGVLWMVLHVTAMLVVRHWLRAPIFFAAVTSRACIGGAASTPIIATAFNPVLVPIGVLLAMAGYAFGTVGGIACAELLSLVRAVWG